jgi:hypothetical protein
MLATTALLRRLYCGAGGVGQQQAAAASSSRNVLSFCLLSAQVGYGEEFKTVGNQKELGNWDVCVVLMNADAYAVSTVLACCTGWLW